MKSKIEWTDYTFNPWWGCTKVSAACKFCYAEALDHRYNTNDPHWGDAAPRKPMSDKYWLQPLKWNRDVLKTGMDKVFCASMADVFEMLPNEHPSAAMQTAARLQLWNLIERTPNLQWQLLTKRPENIGKCVPYEWLTNGFPRNVWLGTTVESQAETKRIKHLLVYRLVCRVLFLSCEPLLTELELAKWLYPKNIGGGLHSVDANPLIDWIIVGGESGSDARQTHYTWIKDLQIICRDTQTPFFFKQWGEWAHDGLDFVRMGKKAAGNILDGKQYLEFPKPYMDGK